MNVDAKFITTLWTLYRLKKVVTTPGYAKVIDANTRAVRGVLSAAMGTPLPEDEPLTAYFYYRALWVRTGDTRYLDLMVRNVDDDA